VRSSSGTSWPVFSRLLRLDVTRPIDAVKGVRSCFSSVSAAERDATKRLLEVRYCNGVAEACLLGAVLGEGIPEPLSACGPPPFQVKSECRKPRFSDSRSCANAQQLCNVDCRCPGS